MTVAPNNEEQVLTLKDLLTNYFNLAKRGVRYWARGLAVVLVVLVAGMYWVMNKPRVYKSEAAFEVIMDTGDRGEEEIQRLVESRLNQVFGSRQYIMDLIRRLHLYDHLLANHSETKIFDNFGDAMSRRVERNLVKLSFVYKEPERAQQTVQGLIELFRNERSIAAQQIARQALETVNAEVSQLRAALLSRETALDDFIRANQDAVTRIRERRQGGARVIVGNQGGSPRPAVEDRSSARTRGLRRRVLEIERSLEALRNPSAAPARPSEEPPEVQALRERLRHKDAEIAAMRSRQMTDAHPTMAAAVRERAQMQADLSTAVARLHGAMQANERLSEADRSHRIEALQRDLERARSELAESARTDESPNAAAAPAGTTPTPAPTPARNPLTLDNDVQVESQYDRLTTDLATTRTSYQDLLRRQYDRQAELERARVAGGERLRLIDPPSLPREPEPPGRVKLSFIVCLIAGLLGAGTALVSGFLDTRIYDSVDLQRWGEAPELPFIPDLFIDVKGGASQAPQRMPDPPAPG